MGLYTLIAVLVYLVACGLVVLGIVEVYFACLDLNAWRGKDR